MQLKSRLFLGGVAAVSILAAYKFGGGAEANVAPPSASVANVTTTNATVAGAGEADVVVMHLIDKAGEARLTMPSLERGTWALSTHWRKMPVAFHDLDG